MEMERNPKKLAVVSSQYSKEKDYWLARLSGELIKNSFPYDHKSKPGMRSVETLETGVNFTGRLFGLLMKLSSKSHSRLHMILVAAVAALLYKYTGSEDIILGSPTLKQDLDVRFINTVLIVRNSIRENMNFKELLLQVRQTIVEATENQNYPLERLLYHLNIPVSGEEFPLFDIAVLLENIHTVKYIEHVRLNLLFSFKALEDSVALHVDYNAGLYERKTVERLLSHLERLLGEVLEKIDIPVSGINFLSREETEKLLYRFNDTEAGYPAIMTVQQLFELQAAKVPGNIAVAAADGTSGTSGTSTLTYGELNRAAGQLAGTLRKKGVKANNIVAVIMDRVLEMPVAILGILKAGGAYLPIDPGYPRKRIDYMLKDSGAKILLSEVSELSKVSGEIEVIDLPSLIVENKDAEPTRLTHLTHPAHLCYIIYTSGTTGQPKGAMIEHRNVVRLMFNDRNPFAFTAEDVWTLFHSYCFDFSVWEMYGALLYGGKLIIIPQMVAVDPPEFLAVLRKNKVTVLNQTPTAFYNLIAEELKSRDKELILRYIIFGGEALAPAKLENWQRMYPGVKFINMYGITETTVHVTYKEIEAEDIEGNYSNIGKPLPTLNTYVMDRGTLLPIGVPGELYVAGSGLARGYMNQGELTREKFVENTYKPGERLYRSGDLVRLMESGEMEYLGRIDQQVKIRGYRIELREIENQLLNHEEIKEAAVIFREGKEGDKNLYAYFVSEKEPGAADLREFLGKVLPEYMIPLSFVQVKEIPLTPNGKLDKNALPLPELKGGADYAAPRDALEEKLVDIWKRVLGADRLGIKDNYFNVGGDSIKAIKLLNSINTRLKTHLRIPDLYLNETIEKLAFKINQGESAQKEEEIKIALQDIAELKNRIMEKIGAGSDSEIEDIYPMSDIEKGMVYHSLKNPGAAQYHDQCVYQVNYRDFNEEIFRKAFTLLVEKHSILRTAFNMYDFEGPVQIVYRKISPDIEHYDIACLEKEEQAIRIKNFILEDRQRVFDVMTAPLWRIRTFSLGNGNIAAAWIFHHAIIDGWSNASLVTELNNTYLELKNNREFIPGKLKCSYKDFVVEQIVVKKKVEIIDYWKEELEDYKRMDFLRGIERSVSRGYHDKKKCTYDLGLPFLEKLEEAAKRYNISVKHLCFAAYTFMLSMLSYENDIVSGLITNNRPICEDGDKVIGCFLNSVPLRLKIPTRIKWCDYFHMVNKKLSELKMYDRMPLAEIVNIIGEKAPDRNPVFDIIFNFVDFYVYGQVNRDNVPGESYDANNQLFIDSYENTNTLFDLTVSTTLRSFSLHLSYSAVLFEDDLVENLGRYFMNVLNKSIDDPGEYAEKDKILTEKERHCLLYEFNDTRVDYPGPKTLHGLFEEQTEQIPGKTAVVFEDEQLTYGELNKKANRLAGILRKKGVKPDSIVGLVAERSIEMIIAILGILKAGGAYLPVDPEFPAERIKYMLEDSCSCLMVTQERNTGKIDYAIESVIMEREETGKGDNRNPGRINKSSDLAYVIYTSGTTGRPKGILTDHYNAIRVVRGTDYIDLTEQDTILQLSNYAFDGSVFDIYGALSNGASLVMIRREEVLSLEDLANVIKRKGVTVFFVTTALFNALVNIRIESFATIRKILFGGERVSVEHVKKALEYLGTGKIIHVYGPTETTVYAAYYNINRVKENQGTVPIGRPLSNTSVYILDRNKKIVSIMGYGEIYIGGDGLARGYLNNPDLTGEKFVENPFIPGGRLYRTGDLARWLPGGNIEFIGRIDQQVKIRGFRIEPGEIQQRLLEIEGIKEVVVTEREDETAEKYLCAYIVSDEEIDSAELRSILSKDLPTFMIPSYFVRLDKIPLTSSGKVDRKALPVPEVKGGEYVAPRNGVEEKLAQIYKDVLVLHAPPGIDEDFFRLGGHSLKVTILVSDIHKAFNIKIPLAEVFRTPTIRSLSQYIIGAVEDEYISIEAVEKKEYYELSSVQKRLYILQQMRVESTFYNVFQVIPLDSRMEITGERPEQIFQKLIERHESLRTSFEMINGEPVQRIHENVEFSIEYYETDNTEKGVEIQNSKFIIQNSFIRPFDLSQAPLLRVGVIKTGEGHYILAVSMHHIITDGASQKLFTREFMALYADEGEELSPLRIQYKDYVLWQAGEKEKERVTKQEAYWLKEFAGEIPLLDLPLDYPRPVIQSFEGDMLRFRIGKNETQCLKALSSAEDATLYMVLLAVFVVFTAKISGNTDIVVGTAAAGRRHADLRQIIGMFVNTLALRNYPVPARTFKEFVNEVKARTLAAFENQEYPFEKLVEKVAANREQSRNPLFDIMLVLQDMEQEADGIRGEETPGPGTGRYGLPHRTAMFDLTWSAVEIGSELFFSVEYSTKLFRRETIERFIRFFKKTIAILVEKPGITLSAIEIISEEEKNQVLFDFNRTAAAYPQDKTIHELFEEQAEQTPAKTAVVFEDEQLTYGELNKKANQLARGLRKKSVKPDSIIGLIAERSLETIIALLGILKSGGAYLPINDRYPFKRKKYLLDDSHVDLIVTRDDLYRSDMDLSGMYPQGKVILIDKEEIYRGDTSNLKTINNSKDLTYIIYTSGTMGFPKGVMVEHRNVVRLVKNTNFVEFKEGDKILQTGALEFDASTFEIWGSLLNGLSLYLVENEKIFSPPALKEIISKYGISTIWMTSPLFNQMVRADAGIFKGIRNVLVGGDVVSPLHVERIREEYPGINVINGYGPTENTTFSATYPVSGECRERIPIGKPIANSSAYIVDRNDNLCPVKVPGELCVGGEGLARGYLNNAGLTGEKFTAHLFKKGERLYRTGDLASWLPDGNIDFMGRFDQQVKIRGFRVEPAEIESRLLEIEGIKEAVVIDRGNGAEEKYLCAYIVPGGEMNGQEVKNILSRVLPGYMIPSYFVQIAKIPLTSNGKVDRKALPGPGFTGREEYAAPRDEWEEKLKKIWAEVLGRDASDASSSSIGIDDNFFELGGHSLKVTFMISKIHKTFDVNVPLAELFVTPTIRGLARYIKNMKKDKFSPIEPVEKKEYYELSSAQKRLYIVQQMVESGTAYNIPLVLPFEGNLDKAKLESTFRRLIARHESLRTSFEMIDGRPVQRVYDEVEFEIEDDESRVKDKAGGRMPSVSSIIKSFVRPFDLAAAPLLRVKSIKGRESVYLLVVDMHHIISDSISLEILEKDFNALHNGEELPALKLQYKDYSAWQNSKKTKETLKQQEEYWLKEFGGDIPVLDLPTDYVRPSFQGFEGSTVSFEISPEDTGALKAAALREEATLYMVLLAVYNIFLWKISSGGDIIIGTPTAGRRHADLLRIIGMFVNTLALRNELAGNKTFSDFLGEVKEKTLAAFENQEYPFEELVDKLSLERDTSRNPIFDVMFNLLNREEHPGEIAAFEKQTTGKPGEHFHIEGNVKFDQMLRVIDYGKKLLFNFEYNVKLFKKDTIERFIGYIGRIIASVTAEPHKAIGEIEIISPRGKAEILSRFNEELKVPLKADTLQARLSESFKKNTDHIALRYGAVDITYSRLGKRAARITRRILARGIERGSFIGIYMGDKIDIIAAMLGILNAGCAFVPLDTFLPPGRIEAMILQIRPRLIVTDQISKEKLAVGNPDLILADAFSITDDSPAAADIKVEYHPGDRIYVYFTSGTTGAPKAIVGKNSSLLQFVEWEIDTFGIDSTSRISQLAAVGFDAFLRNVFTPLCAGGTVCIPARRESILDSRELIDWIDRNGIHLIHCAPALFRLFNSGTLTAGSFRHLKYVLISGDRINPREFENWYGKFGSRIGLVNCYGATETTLIKTYHRIRETDMQRARIPIGSPIRGARAILLDENRNVCDRGIVGEIYIRTSYGTYGYYNDSQLNKEKFIPNPFNDDPADLIYRTGDLGRAAADGALEVIGRIDRQVKIRGIRIEPGEIEYRLQTHDDIKEVVVAARKTTGRDTPETYLAAYIVPVRGSALSVTGLRAYLSKTLPDYMIPSYFMPIDRIPLTPNGKVDWRALPEPEAKSEEEYIAPGNEIEEKLAAIWSDILGVKKEIIGIDADFFRLGGHSLNAAVSVFRIHKEFNVKIPLAEMFKTPTVRELARYIKNASENIYASIEPVEEKEYYPISSAQMRLFILMQMEKDNIGYNMLQVMTLNGDSAGNNLEIIFKKLIERHESLRTSFHMVGEEPVQKVHKTVEFEIEYYDGGNAPPAPPLTIENIIKDFVRPFDLSRAPLLRVGIIEPRAKQPVLLVDTHHIISDGTSQGILEKEFTALAAGDGLSPLRLQYKDYSGWQKELHQEERGTVKQQENYWLKEFEGEIPVINLPVDYTRPVIQGFEGSTVSFELRGEEKKVLNVLALKENVTLYMLLLSIYNILLAKLSGQEEIVVGTPTAGRRHADLERIVGMFVNTLALKNQPVGEKIFAAFLNEVREKMLRAFENQEYPFEKLVEKARVNRDISRNPLFDVMFIFWNIDPGSEAVPRAGITGEKKIAAGKRAPFKYERGIARFDLILNVSELKNRLIFTFEYSTKLFKRATIEKFVNYFKKIVAAAVEAPGKKIAEIEIITEEERKQLLVDFNSTETGYPKNKTIHELFEEQAAITPDNIAIVGPGVGTRFITSVTYHELNRESDRLAHLLKGKGVLPDSIVGIMTGRCVEMIIGILGILKAGGAYMPISPDYPQERIDYMLKDSGAKLLVTTNNLEAPDFPLLPATGHWPPATSLAYVIYTSGSTGKPKGVMIEHRNVNNFIKGIASGIEFSVGKTILALTTIIFDIFVLETLVPLVRGLKVVIADENQQKDPRLLEEILVRNTIDMLQVTPSALKALMYSNSDLSCLKHVKELMVGGEAFPHYLFEGLKERFNGRIYNLYGPTETTVWSTLKDLTGSEGVDIGSPIANTRIYIVDRSYRLQSVGVPGELCIAGDGLVRGYLNKPELTAEKFDQDLWDYQDYRDEKKYKQTFKQKFFRGSRGAILQKSPPGRRRLYKTGDLARWLPDGNIEFLGRQDRQAKIRGFRIELGEIENILLAHDKIKEAVVVAGGTGTGDKYLSAYIVLVDKREFVKSHSIASELIDYLSLSLPAYMIPSYFMVIEKIPLTANGKVDFKALPEPEAGDGEKFAPPGDETEEKLVKIWSKILKIDKKNIGIDSNFFRLGGHSLNAVILLSMLHKELYLKLPLAEVFRFPTIRGLARFIKNAKKEKYESIEPVEKREYYEPSSAQRRMYFLQQMDPGGRGYNISQSFVIKGELAKHKSEETFRELIKHHEILRTSFEIIEGKVVQRVHEEAAFEVDYCGAVSSGPGEGVDTLVKNFGKAFDLSQAPLLRIRLIKVDNQKHILLADMHHIISDELSGRILAGDFIALYRGEELSPLKIQYKDYAEWYSHEEKKEEIEKQAAYWLEMFKGELPLLNLPTDFPRPAVKRFEGNRVYFETDSQLTAEIKRMAAETNVTLYILLLSAFNILLAKYARQEDIVVGSPVTGRRHADLQNSIGMFVNMIAVRSRPRGDMTFREFLAEVKKNTLDAFDKQDYQYEELVNELGIARNPARNPLFDAVFVLQHFDGDNGSYRNRNEIEKENAAGANNLQFYPYREGSETAKFDLLMGVRQVNGMLRIYLEYATSLFRQARVEKMTERYIEILKQVVEDNNIRIKDISIYHDLLPVNTTAIIEDTREDFDF